MAEITAAAVKALREETSQGMMECKKALIEANGDVEAAKDLLRKKGLATAEKKAARVTKEGLVHIIVDEAAKSVAMVEVQCETDFCARNDEFQGMVKELAGEALEAAPGPVDATSKMSDRLQQTLAKIGENMSYARGVKLEATKIGTYLHHNGKVGVVVGVDRDVDDETLTGLCMHIAFSDPMGINPDDVPADVVEKERKFAIEQAVASGKPQEIAEKMVAGKMRKFMEENALMEQNYVRDEKVKIKDLLGGAQVVGFARFAVGETK
jgi:elongation factor Ts